MKRNSVEGDSSGDGKKPKVSNFSSFLTFALTLIDYLDCNA
jgi:hypothetical protein